MTAIVSTSECLATRVAELEEQIARLERERARDSEPADGTLLKTLMADIAQRRVVEAQLRQTSEWLHLAQEAGRVAAYTFDFQSRTLDWSPSTLSLYGFAEGETPTLERWLAAIHPDDRAVAQAVARTALEHGHEIDHRFRILRRDGSVTWVQGRGRLHRSADGTPERLVGINVDVTELVELERRTADGEQRLRLAMQAERIACWDWDPTTGQVCWDENLARYSGLDGDFSGTFEAFWTLVHDDDRDRVRAALDAALAGTSDYDIQFRMRRPDGSLRWTHTRATVVRDAAGAPVRVVGVDADISQSKVQDEALRNSDRFLQSVLDSSIDCIKVVELDGTLSYMNRNGQCIMEVADIVRLLGQPWDGLWPEPGATQVRDALAAARKGQTVNFEAFCPTAAGTPKWWDVSVAPMLDEAGQPVRIVSVSRDITARQAADEQLKLFNAELHHRLKNNLATVQGLARSTMRSVASPEEFEQRFSERLTALSNTYGLLQAGSSAASLGDLVRSELEPFRDGSHVIGIDGPEIMLNPTRAVATGMLLHELTTNAGKYGGLSSIDGSLEVTWRIELRAIGGEQVVLSWLEKGGPSTAAPTRSGFGTKLIDRLVRQMGGILERGWTDTGLNARLTIPVV